MSGPALIDHEGRWFRALGRLGLIGKAALYAIIGALAFMLAIGEGGKTTDKRGALRTVADAPAGEVVLWVLAAALAAYGLWRLALSLADYDNEGSDAEGAVKRVGWLVSGVIYLALAVVAVRIVTGSGGGGGQSASQQTAGVFGWPAGQWIVGAVGLILIGVAAYQAHKGVTQSFEEKLDVGGMSGAERRVAQTTGAVGHVARSVTFAIIGVLLLVAALQHDPSEARGLDGALQELANAPLGPLLLGAVAIGFVAYAAYAAIEARYRRP